MPFFSVIIPCHNCSGTLAATIAALRAQTCRDWEAVLVDDGSTDGTCALLASLAGEDARIRVIRQENAGPSRARNRGAAAARGEMLAFLDADDVWQPTKLASVRRAIAEDTASEVVFGRIAFFRADPEDIATTSTVRPGPATLGDFLGENPVCTLSNLSVTRDAFFRIGGFDEAMRHGEDLEWLVRASLSGARIVAVTDLHVGYRASESGLSADLPAMHAGWRRAVAAAGDRVGRRGLARAEAVHLRYLARRALRVGLPPKTALTLAGRGMRLAPIAFLGGRHRGPTTLAGCLAAPFLPVAVRRAAFA